MKMQRSLVALLTIAATLGLASAAYALSGGNGNDTLWVLNGQYSVVYGKGGNDKIYADYFDRVDCGSGTDTLYIWWGVQDAKTQPRPTNVDIVTWAGNWRNCEVIHWY